MPAPHAMRGASSIECLALLAAGEAVAVLRSISVRRKVRTPPLTRALFDSFATGLRMGGLSAGGAPTDGRDDTALSLLAFHKLWATAYHLPDARCHAAVKPTRHVKAAQQWVDQNN